MVDPDRHPTRTIAVRGLIVAAVIAVVAAVAVATGTIGGPDAGAASGRSANRAGGARGSAVVARVGPAAKTSFTIAATGDLLVHRPVADRARADAEADGGPPAAGPTGPGQPAAYDFRPMLAAVRSELSAADLAICHLETPLTATDRQVTGYPVFNTPWELATAVRWAGYDSCSTASNHSFDQGLRGVTDTVTVLDRVGVAHTGSAIDPAARARIEMHVVDGAKVALLDYTYGLNGFTAPSWAVNLIDPATILRDAAAARRAGAVFVVVQMHWGQEYRTAPTAEQRTLATRLLASPDVDLILGGHVHVVQPIERINGKYVVYGTGNFLSNQTPGCCAAGAEDGVIVTAHVTRTGARWAVSAITYTPTWVRIGDYAVLPVAATLNDPRTPPALRAALTASWRRTVAAVTSLKSRTGLKSTTSPESATGDVRPDLQPRAAGTS